MRSIQNGIRAKAFVIYENSLSYDNLYPNFIIKIYPKV